MIFALGSLGNRRLLPIGWADGTPMKPFLERTCIQVVIFAPELLMLRDWRAASNLPLVPRWLVRTRRGLLRLGRGPDCWKYRRAYIRLDLGLTLVHACAL